MVGSSWMKPGIGDVGYGEDELVEAVEGPRMVAWWLFRASCQLEEKLSEVEIKGRSSWTAWRSSGGS